MDAEPPHALYAKRLADLQNCFFCNQSAVATWRKMLAYRDQNAREAVYRRPGSEDDCSSVCRRTDTGAFGPKRLSSSSTPRVDGEIPWAPAQSGFKKLAASRGAGGKSATTYLSPRKDVGYLLAIAVTTYGAPIAAQPTLTNCARRCSSYTWSGRGSLSSARQPAACSLSPSAG